MNNSANPYGFGRTPPPRRSQRQEKGSEKFSRENPA
jgi:hypothetical protein